MINNNYFGLLDTMPCNSSLLKCAFIMYNLQEHENDQNYCLLAYEMNCSENIVYEEISSIMQIQKNQNK